MPVDQQQLEITKYGMCGSVQEERCLMITLQDAAEPLPPGSKPMPLGAAKRRRGSCLRGTAILLEALPPGRGMLCPV